MTDTMELTDHQISKLKSLHFWRRNLLIARKTEDMPEIKTSRKAIKEIFIDCDKMKIPYSIQNRVLYAAQEDISFCDVQLLKQKETVYN